MLKRIARHPFLAPDDTPNIGVGAVAPSVRSASPLKPSLRDEGFDGQPDSGG